MLLTAAILWAAAGSSVADPSQPEAAPNASGTAARSQQGTTDQAPPQGDMPRALTYEGTYEGESVSESRRSSTTRELAGALSLRASFEGPAVRATLRTTGPLRDARLSGVRTGDQCRLFFGNGDILEGRCDRQGFSGVIRSADGARTRTKVSFSAATVPRGAPDAAATTDRPSSRDAPAPAARVARLVDPDLSPVPETPRASRSLGLTMSRIDDFAFAVVVTPDGHWNGVAQAEWHQGDLGASREDLARHFQVGDNVLIVGLHNKRFAFGPGRWSFSFELSGDQGPVWTTSGGSPGGGVGIRYWKPMIVTKTRAGHYTVRTAPEDKLGPLIERMQAFDRWLARTMGSETSSMAMAAGALTRSLTASTGGGRSAAHDDMIEAMTLRKQVEDDQARAAPPPVAPPMTPIGGANGLYGCPNPPCM